MVVALVTTTFKALFSVAKASGRISGRKLYTGNIYYFFHILTHISPIDKQKVRQPKWAHLKEVLYVGGIVTEIGHNTSCCVNLIYIKSFNLYFDYLFSLYVNVSL